MLKVKKQMIREITIRDIQFINIIKKTIYTLAFTVYILVMLMH